MSNLEKIAAAMTVSGRVGSTAVWVPCVVWPVCRFCGRQHPSSVHPYHDGVAVKSDCVVHLNRREGRETTRKALHCACPSGASNRDTDSASTSEPSTMESQMPTAAATTESVTDTQDMTKAWRACDVFPRPGRSRGRRTGLGGGAGMHTVAQPGVSRFESSQKETRALEWH